MPDQGLTPAWGAVESTASAQRRVAPLMLVAVLSLLIGLGAGLGASDGNCPTPMAS